MSPFEGIRVLDFTHVLAGPFCTYQMAVLGADVIKVEPVWMPDYMREEGTSETLYQEGRNTRFVCQNGNKRSLSVDLRTERGREIAFNIASKTDVLVENYRYGAMQRHGLGYDAVAAVNPSVVYCSMTGFGHSGPKAADPAYDFVIQAFSGLMASTGSAESTPVRVGPAVLDYGTGAQAAFAIAAALFQRTRTGRGQQIDVAMADAALMLMSSNVMDAQTLERSPDPFGNYDPRKAGYCLYETADGKLVMGASTIEQSVRMWRVLGREDIAADVSAMNRRTLYRHRDQHHALLAELFLQDTAEHWEHMMNEVGVPAARVRRVDEAIGHAQIRSRSVLQDAGVVPETGEAYQVPVAAFGFAHGGPKHRRAAPRLGEHTREVLAEYGFGEADIDKLCDNGVVHAV